MPLFYFRIFFLLLLLWNRCSWTTWEGSQGFQSCRISRQFNSITLRMFMDGFYNRKFVFILLSSWNNWLLTLVTVYWISQIALDFPINLNCSNHMDFLLLVCKRKIIFYKITSSFLTTFLHQTKTTRIRGNFVCRRKKKPSSEYFWYRKMPFAQ